MSLYPHISASLRSYNLRSMIVYEGGRVCKENSDRIGKIRRPGKDRQDLADELSKRIVGQPEVIWAIAPCVRMFQVGLAPENRPAGVFLLLGPTGTGKTRTVEALAEALHGNAKSMLRIDCGEFQMEHEVAKLIGAPPGYLGHRETQPALTQQKIAAVASEYCGLSIILFDEIEKAAPSMTRMLLGVLDRGVLKLGDNSPVSFEKTIVFMTSNLGAREMERELTPCFGFRTNDTGESSRLATLGLGAARRKFPPEFINRVDHVITYQPLSTAALAEIVNHEIENLQRHIQRRLGARAFHVNVTPAARGWLRERGTSPKYGARELKRTVHRQVTEPLAEMLSRGQITPGAEVRISVNKHGDALTLRTAQNIKPSLTT